MGRTYSQEYNFSNSVLRSVMVSLIEDLRGRVYIYQIGDGGARTKIDVPFYYSVTGQERFLQDEFVYGAEADGKAIGDYERVPRGVLELGNASIEPTSQTNKFLETRFVKEVNGELRTFVLTACYLPMTMEFTAHVICSNVIEMFKITEALVSKLYAVNVFYTDLGILTMESSYTLPANFTQNKTAEFGLNEKKQFQIDFSLSVNTYMPVLESGITLDEIDTLISQDADQPTDGIYTFRPNKYGEYELRMGGVLKDIRLNVTADGTEKDTMFSNGSETPKDKGDYAVKPFGEDEPQNNRK